MIYNGTNIAITLHANFNLSGATVVRIYYQKPTGVKGFWNATLSGNDQILYNTSVSDIDVPGIWVLQGYVVKGGLIYETSITQMIVEPSLS